MTEDDRALFRAEMFERAAKMLIGEPVDPPAKAGEAAVKPAASEPHVREIETEDHNDVD
ncbi:MAG: hypothetical protein IOC54_15855 [Methylobacterium sp.]|nr:hypothetical protein [Methylobacterium sp.]MCA3646943.1 hypothetical protein [Methylobacterium sp.]MCA3653289.1 hypothetical protein [Methylobacterium sp.]MCA4923630.1 hypothetical protein [Methylobacterium sp.]